MDKEDQYSLKHTEQEKLELYEAVKEAQQAGMSITEITAEIKKAVLLAKPKIIKISCEPVL